MHGIKSARIMFADVSSEREGFSAAASTSVVPWKCGVECVPVRGKRGGGG